MLHAVLAVALVGVACSDATTAPVTSWSASLSRGAEVPAPTGTSTLAGTATVAVAGTSITYTLTLTGVATSTITGAHIHTGATGTAGPIRVNLCGTGAPAPACPAATGGTVASTTVTYASGTAAVLNAPALTFDGLVTAVRGGTAYVNVHTTTNAGGEIRGQLFPIVQ